MMPIKGFDKALTFTQVLKDKVDVGDKVLFHRRRPVLLRGGLRYAAQLRQAPDNRRIRRRPRCRSGDLPCKHPVPARRWNTTRFPFHALTVTEITDKGCTVKMSRPARPPRRVRQLKPNGIGFVPTPGSQRQGQQEGLPRRRLRCHRQPAHGHLARMGRLHEDIVPKRAKISLRRVSGAAINYANKQIFLRFEYGSKKLKTDLGRVISAALVCFSFHFTQAQA